MLTSPEFQSVISQSARLVTENFKGCLEIDLDAKTINVATVMNYVCKFPIDIDVLFPDADPTDVVGLVQVPLWSVILMCQKAALRSAMMDSALDSKPLFAAITALESTVYMG